MTHIHQSLPHTAAHDIQAHSDMCTGLSQHPMQYRTIMQILIHSQYNLPDNLHRSYMGLVSSHRYQLDIVCLYIHLGMYMHSSKFHPVKV